MAIDSVKRSRDMQQRGGSMPDERRHTPEHDDGVKAYLGCHGLVHWTPPDFGVSCVSADVITQMMTDW